MGPIRFVPKVVGYQSGDGALSTNIPIGFEDRGSHHRRLRPGQARAAHQASRPMATEKPA
jgi:hypothetical protein